MVMEAVGLHDQEWIEAANINQPTIAKYFLDLNNGNYAEVAELFSDRGCLYPPFGKPICGQAAITHYLETEAKGMMACPGSITILTEDFENLSFEVSGKVKTSFFTVNLSWIISLDSEQKIFSIKVKLLDQLQDLLALTNNRS
jgi:Nuclear transport factor 2 (NTF2) domain